MKLEKDDTKSAVNSLMQYAERELPEPLESLLQATCLTSFYKRLGR